MNMAIEKFSIFEDPSFDNFTEDDWKEWRENHKDTAEKPAICVGCLNQCEDGSCDVCAPAEQRSRIVSDKCDDRLA
jgi:hypothetical protein